MTINDLKKVYRRKVCVTVLGFFSNGEYYSFRTAYPPQTLIKEVDEYISSLEILSTYVYDGTLWIDVKEILSGEKE